MKRTAICTVILALSLMASAQTPEKALYSTQKLGWQSPWLDGDNSAAHVLNTFFLPDSVCSYTSAVLRAE